MSEFTVEYSPTHTTVYFEAEFEGKKRMHVKSFLGRWKVLSVVGKNIALEREE